MAADLVITNARIRTMDPTRPAAEALAAVAGRIAAIGCAEDVSAAVGPRTQVLDLDGASVVPGLIDTHLHLTKLGLDLAKLVPTAPRSSADLVRLVAEAASGPGQGWLWVFGEDHVWELHDVGGQLPDTRDLDSAAPDRPVICHCGPDEASVNSAAIRSLADGWNDLLPYAERDVDGDFTGRLRGPGVLGRLKRLEPPPTPRELRAAVERAMDRLSRSGITTVLDCGRAGGFIDDLRAYASVMEGGRLPVRVIAMMRPRPEDLSREVENLDRWPVLTGQYLATGWIKAFADGEIQDALMIRDYPGRPGYRGVQLLDEAELYSVAVKAVSAGYKVCVHASGDGAVALVLRAFSKARKELGDRWQRGSGAIAHGFLADADTIAQCRELGVTMFIQPSLAFAFGDEMKEAWGTDRADRVNPYRTILESGLEVGAGSDIYPPEASLGLWAARTRQTIGGRLGCEEECLSSSQVLELFTVRGARAIGRSDVGMLVSGSRCDLTAFAEDPVLCDADELPRLEPVLTMVGGDVTWRA